MKVCNFSSKKLDNVVSYMLKNYNKLRISDTDYKKIIDLIGHDKKNEGLNINFTLLEDFGKIKINQNCDNEVIIETLNWYRNL
jgi:3-dehydroquinate synthase